MTRTRGREEEVVVVVVDDEMVCDGCKNEKHRRMDGDGDARLWAMRETCSVPRRKAVVVVLLGGGCWLPAAFSLSAL